MGYRLEIYEMKYKACGGKLYGYVDIETLEKCKSWKWLMNRGYINEDNNYTWYYYANHDICLFGDDLKEFLKLYLEDYEKYGYNCDDTKEELKNLLDCNRLDRFVIAWE